MRIGGSGRRGAGRTACRCGGGGAARRPAPPAHAQVLAVGGSRARRRRFPQGQGRDQDRPPAAGGDGPGRARPGSWRRRRAGRGCPRLPACGRAAGAPAGPSRPQTPPPRCEELRRGEGLPESRADAAPQLAAPRPCAPSPRQPQNVLPGSRPRGQEAVKSLAAVPDLTCSFLSGISTEFNAHPCLQPSCVLIRAALT